VDYVIFLIFDKQENTQICGVSNFCSYLNLQTCNLLLHKGIIEKTPDQTWMVKK